MKQKLFLVPSPLGDTDIQQVIPSVVFPSISHVTHFAVEELRSARRYLSKLGFRGNIESLNFYEINEHSTPKDIEDIFAVLKAGNDMALISEAGLPAVADPGAALVSLAHKGDIDVVPFVGPSSLMMALMSSGLNGQCFAFCGYIPVKKEERKKRLKDLEARSKKYDETEIIIETPYRNDALFEDILSTLQPSTKVTVAANITMPDQYIKTKTVAVWKKDKIEISKRPCVFLIYA